VSSAIGVLAVIRQNIYDSIRCVKLECITRVSDPIDWSSGTTATLVSRSSHPCLDPLNRRWNYYTNRNFAVYETIYVTLLFNGGFRR